MFIIFDGTGPTNDGDYAVEFAGSHCKTLSMFVPKPKAYFRGPAGDDLKFELKKAYKSADTLDGLTFSGHAFTTFASCLTEWTGAIVADAYFEAYLPSIVSGISARGDLHAQTILAKTVTLLKEIRTNKEKLFVAGHSRGGLAALIFAHSLRHISPDTKIEAMFLFDAVGMDTSFSPMKYFEWHSVPSNVLKCYHAHRSNELRDEYKSKIIQLKHDRENTVRSTSLMDVLPYIDVNTMYIGNSPQANFANNRIYETDMKLLATELALECTRSDNSGWININNWGNVGMEASDKSLQKNIEKKAFKGSHGALGGCPWPDNIIQGDSDYSRLVKEWMWEKVKRHVTLHYN